MKKSKVTKLIVQAVAAGFGALGLMSTYLGLDFAVTGIRDTDRFLIFYMTPMFLLFGGIFIAVAWQNLRYFGPTAIRNVTALVMFLAYTDMSTVLDHFLKAIWDSEKELDHLPTFLIPMLVAYLLYRVVSRRVIELTETDSIQPEVGQVSPEAAPGALPDEPST